MNLPLLLTVTAHFANNQSRPSAASASMPGSSPGQADRDLVWQRALEKALEQADLSSWFKPWTPNDATRGAVPESSPEAVLPQSSWQNSPTTLAAGLDVGASRWRSDPLSSLRDVPPAASPAHPGADTVACHASSSDATATVNADTAPSAASHEPAAAASDSHRPGSLSRIAAMAHALTNAYSTAVLPVASAVETANRLSPSEPAVPALSTFNSTSQATVLALPSDTDSAVQFLAIGVGSEQASEDAPSDGESAVVSNTSSTMPTNGSVGGQSDVRAPLRLYAEWSAQGVRIWLGADADQVPLLNQLTQQVQQWLSSQGERLLALVCNGRTVWRVAQDESASHPAMASTASLPASFMTASTAEIPFPDISPTPPDLR
jgi:hypothetical protein